MTGIQLVAIGAALRWSFRRFWPDHLPRALVCWCVVVAIAEFATGDHFWAAAFAGMAGYGIGVGALQPASASEEETP